ncbi:ring finger domain containing protein [Nitzschia inconspicua]|uniref:Ring finger domain containing protein n=1 Tax=Nitzschia inconspicua TaxID=303405 RepID=A0A9K3LVG1_9STRA|nr:ring finger domain containing protein [Nitzschia inconspicua]
MVSGFKRRTALGCCPCLHLLLLLVLPLKLVSATISIVESGRTFESKPDYKVGQRLWKGYQYMGRTQLLHENQSLCPQNFPNPSSKLSIIKPDDGLPVALIVNGGGCSLADKAIVATTMIEPSGVVQYLIIKDHGKKLMKSLEGPMGHDKNDESLEFEYDLLDTDFVMLNDNSNETTTTTMSSLLATDDESYVGRFLKQGEQPPVALIHVSSRVGNILENIVTNERRMEREAGGTKILLNGEGPNGPRTLLTWMMAVLFMCACGCCCMLMAVQTNVEDERQQAPAPPVRRRLTLQEVRTRFPAFHFNPDDRQGANNNNNDDAATQQYCQLLDECTICLDEFHTGVRCRQLPCQHVFHSTCIARWLIERSAVCPLCKMDLFEDEEEEEEAEEDGDSNQNEPNESDPLFSRGWWTGRTGPIQQSIPSAEVEGEQATNGDNPGTAPHTRTWWPFSVEVATSPEEEENNRSNRSRPSRWRWNLFGRQRFQVGGGDSDVLVTELTEPLIVSSDAETTESLVAPTTPLNPQHSLEEIAFVSPVTEAAAINEAPVGTNQSTMSELEVV